jgi:aminobenzoyl-glutamate utilization protein B
MFAPVNINVRLEKEILQGGRMRLKSFLTIFVVIIASSRLYSQESKYINLIDEWINKHTDELKAMNQSIWNNPEIGLQETHAAEVLITFLEKNGFSVQSTIADMPTAFVASAGSGKPVIAILAEYDALPGLSQAATPNRQARSGAPIGSEQDIGHGCGHSVFGVGSVGAATAAWQALKNDQASGTIRLYGTPAEETGIGKVYMVKAGVFDDVDVVLHWHVSSSNGSSYSSSKAKISVKYRFEGQAAHASINPHQGHSALDAVELMNVGVNYLREHLRQDVRVHYVITEGGGQPNVVPPVAEVWYYIRADDHKYVEYTYERISEIALGAAQMTRTELIAKIVTDVFEILPNRPLSELLHRHFGRVGPPQFTEEDMTFAKQMQESLEAPLATLISDLPDIPDRGFFSSDVGNVSWRTPTGGIHVASFPKGLPMHSWYVVACTGMSIGEKAMIVAARCLAGATLNLFTDPNELRSARQDFRERIEKNELPTSVLPENQIAPQRIR